MIFASFPPDSRSSQPSSPTNPEERQRAAYWDAKIQQWAQSSYEKNRSAPMAILRSSIDARKEEAKRLLRDLMKPGYSMLDLGCGAGQFAIEALQECGAAKVLGRDFSPQAIHLADSLRRDLKISSEQIQFETASVEAPFPADVDVITGLGLLDWLEPAQIESLFLRLRKRRFLLSYSEKDGSIAELIHRIYLVWGLQIKGGGVRAYHHDRDYIMHLAEQACPGMAVGLSSAKGMRFGKIVYLLAEIKK